MPRVESLGSSSTRRAEAFAHDDFDTYGTFNDEVHDLDDDGPPLLPAHLEPRSRRHPLPRAEARHTPAPQPDSMPSEDAWILGAITLGMACCALALALLVA